jgi:hypothetical protein
MIVFQIFVKSLIKTRKIGKFKIMTAPFFQNFSFTGNHPFILGQNIGQ